MMVMEKRIKQCEIKEQRFMNIVSVVYDDGTVEDHFRSYYPDELSFTPDEFIGLTRREASVLMERKDAEYLRG